MAKCSRCKQAPAENSSGLCAGCHEFCREAIKTAKDMLTSLRQEVENGGKTMGAAEAEANALIAQLRRDNVPLPDSLKKQYAYFSKPDGNKVVPNAALALCIVFAVSTIALAIFFVRAKNTVSSLNVQLSNAQAQISDLESQVAELKLGDAAGKKQYVFDSGNYEVGVDIEAGTYDFEALSGYGNVYTNDYAFIATMATKDMDTLNLANQTYQNVPLENGVILTVDSVKVKLKRVE